ncbi:hypothetical protein SSBR45G_17120 [Bradyrhizobium sp. SSBR45G]|uniref:hypothetical protein n=1 Tax=unclassified Bradyrhizobium TaxID=2631580 RepID=UPI002342BB17|nr:MULTISPECIES: hypothetical protein [unclassified Bradyrhizobium]GLH76804.1 hypothetical protein SSBR45G_17120 [Bradyrhizobium sp. SSBR45G]GLH83562.1 hypothetical protein SSBR45R_10220 [Bradyrhizobium sp. SSBR45R]
MSFSIARGLALMALAVVTLIANAASATQDIIRVPDLTNSGLAIPGLEIRRAVFADGRLWLLHKGGQLSSLAENGERVDVTTLDRVIELFIQHGHATIVTCPQQTCTRWTVRQRVGDDWAATSDIASQDDAFLAAMASGDTITVVTDNRLIEIDGGTQTEIPLVLPPAPWPGPMLAPATPSKERQPETVFALPPSYVFQPSLVPSKPLKNWPVGAVLMTPKYVFIGYSAGEWGGGLQRVERATGMVSDIIAVDDDLCGGPLNPACDPVNGLAIIPWKPDCVAAAIGLIHSLPHGRLVEVCQNTVRVLYAQPIPDHLIRDADGPPARLRLYTIPFFGVQRLGGDLLAAGYDGLYRIGPNGLVQRDLLPAFKRTNDVGVSFDIAGLALVRTEIDQRLSSSGSAPMVVPR